MTPVRCVSTCANQLGEGPCWASSENRLYWFDIQGRRLHWLDPATGAAGDWRPSVRASAAAPRAAGGLIAATEAGLAHIDGGTGCLRIVQALAAEEGFRSNDGKIDIRGRFWWSTMDDHGVVRPGRVLRSDPNGVTHEVVRGIHIANTVAVSPEGDRLYLADSKHQSLRAHPLDAGGEPGPPRIFANPAGTPGTPDGGAIDAKGYLWNAQWGVWRLVRYAPDGRVDRIVPMPIQQPTSCAFGGPDLATLYVASAREGLSAAALNDQPLAGGLSASETDIPGLRLPPFTG